MKLFRFLPSLFLIFNLACAQQYADKIDLSGAWNFKIDSLDEGISEKWFSQTLTEMVNLPGSMAENGKGENITTDTKWTGNIVDRSWFNDDKYVRYRKEGNIKIPFCK